MISDAILMYLIGMLIIFMINIYGYARLPLLCLVAFFGQLIILADSWEEFGDFWAIAVTLSLANALLSFSGLYTGLKE